MTLLIFVVLTLGACRQASPKLGKVLVPQDENIPGYGQKLHAIPLQSTGLQGTFNFNRTRFDVLNAEPTRVDFQIAEELLGLSIDDNRFIVLDKVASVLLEIDVFNSTVDTLASPGDGPGELSFPSDLSLFDRTLYVYLGVGKVLQYDCNSKPCRYASIARIPVLPNSATVTGEGGTHVVSTTASFVFDDSGQPSEIGNSTGALTWITTDGEILRQQGSIYDFDDEWMLADPFVNKGMVREKSGFVIFTNERLPLIGLINPAGSETLYRLDGFVTGKQEYDLSTGRLEALSEDHSRVKLLPIGSDGRLIAEISDYTNRRVENFSYQWDIQSRYYTIESPFPALSPFGTFNEGTYLLASSRSGLLFAERGSIHFSSR